MGIEQRIYFQLNKNPGILMPLKDEETLAERVSCILSHYEETNKTGIEARLLQHAHSDKMIYLSNIFF